MLATIWGKYDTHINNKFLKNIHLTIINNIKILPLI